MRGCSIRWAGVLRPSPPEAPHMDTTTSLLRLTAVKARTGLSRTTIYRRMDAGTFPRPVPISAGLVGWYEADIDSWVADPMGWSASTAPEPHEGT